MIVLDASMGWILGGAAAGVTLIGLLARQRARRRLSGDEIRMPASDSMLGASGFNARASVTPSVLPAAAASVSAASQSARTSEAIRAEIAAHAQRLAAKRAARAAQPLEEAGETPVQDAALRSAHSAVSRVVHPAGADADAAELPREVFDPTRSTPWQQVVESVARARHGEPAPVISRTSVLNRVVPISAARGHVDAAAAGDRPRRVLVADDARVVRVKLQRLLSSQGWQVIEAADGDEALRLLTSERPDVLITDVAMPGLDGFALTRAVRSEPATAQLPVIMITAADDLHREEASRAGVTVLLGKPYGEAALVAHLRRLLGQRPATPVVTVAPVADAAVDTVADTAAA